MIYFDNAATTRALPSVAEKMTMMLCEQYGNPASVSAMGLAVEKEIRNAADIIARGIRAKNEEIFFTSGGTEGAAKTYIDAYKAKYGNDAPLNQFGAAAYDCVYAIYEAMKASGECLEEYLGVA